MNHNIVAEKKQDTLNDVIKGKMTEKKQSNVKYYNLVSSDDVQKKIYITQNTIRNIHDCGSFMQFLADEKLENFKLEHSNNCRNRFCPRCSWLKSRKDAVRLATAMQYIKKEEDKAFIFLTLTVPNVSGSELETTIKRLNKSFQLLYKRKEVKAIIKGFYRKIEVTYNAKRNDYHPHFHVLIVVNRSYFTHRTYIKQKDWLQLWRDCYDDQTITQVDVRKTSAENYEDVLEMAKYSAKDSDYMENGVDVFSTFYTSLKGKRLTVPGGLVKKAFKLYDNGELENILDNEEIEYIYRIVAKWTQNEYKTEIYEIDEDE